MYAVDNDRKKPMSDLDKQERNKRIPCTEYTRELVKSYKRGDEDYDTLLRQMAEQYDPDAVERTAPAP